MASKPPEELPFNKEALVPSPPLGPAGRRNPTRQGAPRARSADKLLLSSASAYNELSEPGFRPAHIYVERGPGAGQLMPIRQGTLTIGRASVSDLRLLHPSISRHHAELVRRGERFFLRDLGSQNGTFVNRTRVTEEVEVKPGDMFALGHATLRLRASGGAEDDASIIGVLRNRWTVARWAVFVAAMATGFALVSIWQVYRLTAIPVVEVTTQAEPAPTALVRVHPPSSRQVKPAVRARVEVALPAEPSEAASAPEAKGPTPTPSPTPARLVKHLKPVALQTPPRLKPAPLSRPTPIVSLSTPAAKLEAAAAMTAARSGTGVSNLLAELEPTDTLAGRYEGGDATGALELARQAGDASSAQLLIRFRRLYADAQRALAAHETVEAKRQFEAALDVDGQLARGRGWYHAEIKRHLSSLTMLEGDRELSRENTSAARQSYREAVSLNPSNRSARSKLDALEDELPFASAPAKLRGPRSDTRSTAIEEAFEKE